jgi:hypothetical protein
VRQAVARSNGGQVNDPAKGAAAIYAAVTAGQPPLRFQVGPDAVAMVEDKLVRVRDERQAWRCLASSTSSPAPLIRNRLRRPSWGLRHRRSSQYPLGTAAPGVPSWTRRPF